jgi:hypothetical protein
MGKFKVDHEAFEYRSGYYGGLVVGAPHGTIGGGMASSIFSPESLALQRQAGLRSPDYLAQQQANRINGSMMYGQNAVMNGLGIGKIKEGEKKMGTSYVKDYLVKHRELFLGLTVVILLDQFVFGGVFREKLKRLVNGFLDRAEAKLSADDKKVVELAQS